ncbi:sporulation phosphorelay system protein KapB [Alteribacillus bidgolensis]|uniref:Kinase-associated protein B n=1 Tax=Alteribacillus bidgolensis TaxID=930129 RepID=A0A1G8CCH2_9BACI|nr:sporulation phosphorelay system protein KapB [Alteribacillus bidgolensis]SDH43207.1 kinase-associated protein B [Alteribacillus bidgolensis]
MAENNIVKAPYKTGLYVGEILKEKENKRLIKVIAVLKHPKQGDLHNPNQVEVPLFHERKALAENEKVWVPASVLNDYEESIPSYEKSLKMAVETMVQDLHNKKDPYSQKALETLNNVSKDYPITIHI